MNGIGLPAQFLHRLHGAVVEEDCALVVISAVCAKHVSVGIQALKVIVVIHKIHLNTRRVHGRHLDNERMVGIVDRDIDAAEPYHLVQLISALVDGAEPGHEDAHLVALCLTHDGQVAPQA